MCGGVGAVGIAHAEVDDVLAAAARRELELAGDVEDVGRQRGKAAKGFQESLLRSIVHDSIVRIDATGYFRGVRLKIETGSDMWRQVRYRPA